MLSRAVCVGMCLLQNLKLQRMRAGEMWAKYLGHETWHTIREVALQVKEEKFVLPKGVDAAQGDLLQVVETMHELMQEKFEAMQERILVLEKALAEQTPSVSPTLPFKRSTVNGLLLYLSSEWIIIYLYKNVTLYHIPVLCNY